ncbi:MAG: Arylsulfatase [Verrucomicrobiota bacterium]|jgi:arylsulfatase A-like enzyme
MKLKTLALSLLLGLQAIAAPSKPNFVFIFIDDMGYADIGPFGNTQLRTPHLDTLAKQGRKFTSYYATPVCSMSRASLLTGCYNSRVSLPGVIQPWFKIGLNPDEDTIADVLKKQGYATACFGKWHLGHHPEFMPLRQGFDEYFGIPYSNNMLKGYGPKQDTPPLPLYQGEEIIETEPDQSQFTRRFTEAAIKFIRAKKDQPFFVYLPHPMIHVPLFASAGFKGKSADGLVGDAIEEIDWSVGQITATLKELNLEENTLVVFTSDNGPDRRDAPPFRGSKGSTYEGGVREPCIMRWPGKIPAATTCDQILGNIDMLPTFAKLAGATLNPNKTLDGMDVSSLLFDAAPKTVRDTHLYYDSTIGEVMAIRQGDWKLFLQIPVEKGGKGKGKKANPDSGPALYNLKTDQAEAANVAGEHPELVARLKEEATRRNTEIMANQRPPGTLK